MEVNLHGKDSVTVTNAYAPTSSAEDVKVEQFYDDIERAMTPNMRSLQGNQCKNWNWYKRRLQSMGAFGIGERNEGGYRLIEFAEEHKPIIANTLFQKPKNRYWT